MFGELYRVLVLGCVRIFVLAEVDILEVHDELLHSSESVIGEEGWEDAVEEAGEAVGLSVYWDLTAKKMFLL